MQKCVYRKTIVDYPPTCMCITICIPVESTPKTLVVGDKMNVSKNKSEIETYEVEYLMFMQKGRNKKMRESCMITLHETNAKALRQRITLILKVFVVIVVSCFII